ncbi:MAG TPA: gluconeogenesis factor YvcK family protein [Acidimicrobiia bacterium]
MTATEVAPATQLDELLLDPKGPKVAALGGGHGLSITLEALQSYASEITAVVAVADDGGSSGRLTTGLGVPPPGDIRRCLLALTPDPSVWSELFAYRFQAGDIEDHSLGNLLLAALTDLTGDFASAVELAGRLLRTVGKVIPAANEPAILTATIGGRVIAGQAAITKARGGVTTMALGPVGISANPNALAAIASADQIVLGPGSLFTSLMAVLMVPGIVDAWKSSKASKVFVLNLLGQDGETLGLDGAGHLAALADMAGVTGPGTVLGQEGTFPVPPGVAAVAVGVDEAARYGWDLVTADLCDLAPDWPAHEPMALGRALAELALRS